MRNRQGKHGRTLAFRSSSPAPFVLRNQISKDHGRRCYICGETDHIIGLCKSPVFLKTKINRLLGNDKSYVSSIMYELCTCAESMLHERHGEKTAREKEL